MELPDRLASREFSKYMYRPLAKKDSDIYLETLLVIAWILMMLFIVNIYKFCIRNIAQEKHLQKPRYMTSKARTPLSRYQQKSVNSIAS